jgi:hypothetical protein
MTKIKKDIESPSRGIRGVDYTKYAPSIHNRLKKYDKL